MSEYLLLTGINRPEYYGNPDALLADIAWRSLHGRVPSIVHKYVFEPAPGVYETDQKKAIVVRRPGDASIADAVRSEFVAATSYPLPQKAGAALLDGCRGVRPEQGHVYPATAALWPGVFLQGLAGTTKKTNPANYKQIVDTLYAWGAPGSTGAFRSASRRIIGATLREVPNDPVARIAAAIAGGISNWADSQPLEVLKPLKNLVEYRDALLVWSQMDEVEAPALPAALSINRPTPFQWFYEAINRLCSDAWREAMPTRRWTDWLGCVLRTGIGLGFLYEMRYFRGLGQALVSGDDDWSSAVEPKLKPAMLQWYSPQTATSERDVAGRIKRWTQGGDNVRRWLEGLATPKDPAPAGIADAYSRLVGHLTPDDLAELQGRLTRPNGGTNVHYTIIYSLQCRERFSEQADLHSLLLRRGRYLVVEPGEEWIVVIASLCCDSPGTATTLGELRRTLQLLGIEANRDVVIAELERAGLTRSAHDADDALEITPAF